MRPFDDPSLSDARRASCRRGQHLWPAAFCGSTRGRLCPTALRHRPAPKNSTNPGAPSLEVPDETVLSVHNG